MFWSVNHDPEEFGVANRSIIGATEIIDTQIVLYWFHGYKFRRSLPNLSEIFTKLPVKRSHRNLRNGLNSTLPKHLNVKIRSDLHTIGFYSVPWWKTINGHHSSTSIPARNSLIKIVFSGMDRVIGTINHFHFEEIEAPRWESAKQKAQEASDSIWWVNLDMWFSWLKCQTSIAQCHGFESHPN